MKRLLASLCSFSFLFGCQSSTVTPVAGTLSGAWRLSGSQGCVITLKNAPAGVGWEVTNDGACPQPFSTLRSWALYGDDLVLRNRAGEVVARFQPAGASRFDGRTEQGGQAVSLTRG